MKQFKNFKVLDEVPDNDFTRELKKVYEEVKNTDFKSITWNGKEKKFKVNLNDNVN